MASPITSLAPARGREAGDVEGRHGDDAERPSARGPGGAEPDASTAELLHARGGGHQQSSSTWAAVAPCGAGRGRIRTGGGIRVGGTASSSDWGHPAPGGRREGNSLWGCSSTSTRRQVTCASGCTIGSVGMEAWAALPVGASRRGTCDRLPPSTGMGQGQPFNSLASDTPVA